MSARDVEAISGDLGGLIPKLWLYLRGQLTEKEISNE